ncbi:MAG: hypothetical protein Kow0025_11310 [Thermodesulfovibrionales bacterium]
MWTYIAPAIVYFNRRKAPSPWQAGSRLPGRRLSTPPMHNLKWQEEGAEM